MTLLKMTRPNLFRFISLLALVICLSIKGECQKERLIGGVFARPDDFKYVVYVKSVGEGLLGTCTGGILSQTLIITAAHCVFNEKTNKFYPRRITVIAGTNDINNPSNPGIEVSVQVVMIPWYFNGIQTGYDIALLRLKQPLDLKGKKLAPLSLPTTSIYRLRDQRFKLAGFGLADVNRKVDGKLRHASVQLDEFCQHWHPSQIPATDFCAKMINNRRLAALGACLGDSGGPLVHGMTVYGVTSFVAENCNENYAPSVFTSVYDSTTFIKQALAGQTPGRFKIADKEGYF